MFYYTRSRISDVEMAKDLVQETFLSALKAMPNFQGKSNERTWLIAILKRKKNYINLCKELKKFRLI